MNNTDSFQMLANIVKYHRKKSGLSRLEVAKLAEVGKTVVFDIEHGKQTVRLNTLMKILTVLNISIEFNSPLMEAYREQTDEKREDICE